MMKLPNLDSFQLNFPRKIVFESGAVLRLADYLPASLHHILIVAGNHLKNSGIADSVRDSLCNSGRDASIFYGVPAEPPPEAVDRIADAARTNGADAVFAIGGGSVIDAGKAAAALAGLPGKCAEYFSGERRIPGPGLFFGAAPTTAGTGAEMTNNSVLTDPDTQIKKSLRSPYMTALLAVIDPTLLANAAAEQIAGSGMDAFIQAVESYTSPKGSDVSRVFAREAVMRLYPTLPAVFTDPANAAPDTRTLLAEGSMLSGLSFSQCGLGAIHGIAHPVGSLLHVPHGIACAILMPAVLAFNLPVCRTAYAELAAALGLPHDADSFLRAADGLGTALAIPKSLASWHLRHEHFDFIVKNCRSASMNANPRPMSDDDVKNILQFLL